MLRPVLIVFYPVLPCLYVQCVCACSCAGYLSFCVCSYSQVEPSTFISSELLFPLNFFLFIPVQYELCYPNAFFLKLHIYKRRRYREYLLDPSILFYNTVRCFSITFFVGMYIIIRAITIE